MRKKEVSFILSLSLIFLFIFSGCSINLKDKLPENFKLETFSEENTQDTTYKEDFTEVPIEYDIKNDLNLVKTFPNSTLKTKVPDDWTLVSGTDMDVYRGNNRALYLITINSSYDLSPEAMKILSSTSFSEMYSLFDSSGQIKKLQSGEIGLLSFFSEFSPTLSLIGTCNYMDDKIYGSAFFATTDSKKNICVEIYVIEKDNSLERDTSELKDFADSINSFFQS